MTNRNLLLESYREGPELLEKRVKELTQEQLDYKPSSDRWSAREVIIHIADSEANAFLRYRSIIAESGKDAFVVDEAGWAKQLFYQSQQMDDYIALFRVLRKINYSQLLLIKDEDVWTKNYTKHSYMGIITLDRWLQTYVDHLHTHLAQIDRNIMELEALKSK